MYSLNGGRKAPVNLLHRYNTYSRYTYKEIDKKDNIR